LTNILSPTFYKVLPASKNFRWSKIIWLERYQALSVD
jgi:hypothetical protein